MRCRSSSSPPIIAHEETSVEWLDISAAIDPSMPTFEGDPPVLVERVKSLAGGDVCNLTRIDMGAHSGTHIDAVVHFVEGGSGSEAIPLEAVMGPAWVVDARNQRGPITARDVARYDIPRGETRLLFRTPNSGLWERPGFQTSFVGFDAGGAAALVERRPALVGIDYLSIAPFGDPTATHVALLSAGVVILEGLDLRRVEPGPYELLCLPLRIVGSDGAPARALVRPRL
jgi:arylformamidase